MLFVLKRFIASYWFEKNWKIFRTKHRGQRSNKVISSKAHIFKAISWRFLPFELSLEYVIFAWSCNTSIEDMLHELSLNFFKICQKTTGNVLEILQNGWRVLPITPLRPKQYLKSFYCYFLFGHTLGRDMSYYSVWVVGSYSDISICFQFWALSSVNTFTVAKTKTMYELAWVTSLIFNALTLK